MVRQRGCWRRGHTCGRGREGWSPDPARARLTAVPIVSRVLLYMHASHGMRDALFVPGCACAWVCRASHIAGPSVQGAGATPAHQAHMHTRTHIRTHARASPSSQPMTHVPARPPPAPCAQPYREYNSSCGYCKGEAKTSVAYVTTAAHSRHAVALCLSLGVTDASGCIWVFCGQIWHEHRAADMRGLPRCGAACLADATAESAALTPRHASGANGRTSHPRVCVACALCSAH